MIKVGVFLPLTGDNAAGGELELRGIKLANKLHPEVLGKKIELVVADNKSDKAEAASVAARLIEKDKVSVIVGSYGSSLSMAAGNIVKDSKVPAVGTSCTNPQVTANNDYYFRACFIDPFQGTVMANYAFKQGAKKVAIVQEVSNDYAVGLAKFFKEAFIKLTGDENSIVEIANYQTGDKDFSAILTNIKAKNPDAIFAPGNFTESALLVKQARQLGIEAPFMGGDTWETQEFIDVGGKDVDVRCIELGGKRHFLIQVFLFFGKAADLLRSDVVFAGNVGYHLFLMGSEAAQGVYLVDIAYHYFTQGCQFFLQSAYFGGIGTFYGTEFFQQTLRFQLFLLQKDGKGVVGYGELQFIVLLGEVGVLVFQVFLFQVEFLHQLVVGAFF